MTREFIDYFEEDIPAIFELGLHPKETNIKVSVHSSFANFLQDILSDPNSYYRTNIASRMQSNLILPDFQDFSDQDKSWGFGGVMKPLANTRPNWLSWDLALPKGVKNDNTYWTNLYSTSATLEILTNLVRVFEGKTDSSDPQLFYLDLYTARGMHGGSLSVDLTAAIIPWISDQREQVTHPGIVKAMKEAYSYMYPSDLSMLDRFLAWFRPPCWINLSVPGNACGLDPVDYFVDHTINGKRTRGYRLAPHNIDSPLQQLSLISGIAYIHDQAREFFKK